MSTDPYTYAMDYREAFRKAFARPNTTRSEAEYLAHKEAGRRASERSAIEQERARRNEDSFA
jgi:hypothetical protein